MDELKIGQRVAIKNSFMAERVFITYIERTLFGKRYSVGYQLPDKTINIISGWKKESLIGWSD